MAHNGCILQDLGRMLALFDVLTETGGVAVGVVTAGAVKELKLAGKCRWALARKGGGSDCLVEEAVVVFFST
jgi:hypothetical protein